MHIERVQVEEGFLDGLDVHFSAGLNVIIGARGTGKTSLIELIRFCLDSGGNSEIARKSRDHALSILGSGQVTVTLNNKGQQIIVTRTASDSLPRSTGHYKKPIIFSQTEVETIGLEASGRLRLIDGFIEKLPSIDAAEEKAAAEVRSLTTEIERYRKEIDELKKQIVQKPFLLEEIKTNASAELAVAQTSSVLQEKTQLLNKLADSISQKAVLTSEVARAKEGLAVWHSNLKNASDSAVEAQLGSESVLKQYQEALQSARTKIQNALNEIATIYHHLDSAEKAHTQEKINSENTARALRVEIESLQAGAGNVMRRSQELVEKMARLDAISELYATKEKYLSELIDRRGQALESLDQSRLERFEKRKSMVAALNARLMPNIHIRITKNGQYGIFASALAEALRGSGVKYGEVAPALAEQISPRALLDAVESFDVDLISEAANITTERASRILTHLRNSELGTLGTINIEDEVSLQLLDGRDYKNLNELSTGQRCTVILPLVLAHQDRILVVDQPEDHIDNAFIASTLIKAVLSRNVDGQILFSTHNPNIPVLGNADTVFHLGSDGRRGYKIALGKLEDQHIVNAISTVMEGGAEAFSRRVEFYNRTT